MVSLLTGFSKANNLLENIDDRLAISNLVDDVLGINNDIDLFANNLRNNSSLVINSSEWTYTASPLYNQIVLNNLNFDDFVNRSNVFTNGDIVDIFDNDPADVTQIIKINDNPLYVKESDSLTSFSLTTNEDLSGYWTTAWVPSGDFSVVRTNAVFTENFRYLGISNLKYQRLGADPIEKLFGLREFLEIFYTDFEKNISQRRLKYRKDGTIFTDIPIKAEGYFSVKGDVATQVDNLYYPGLYIVDSTSEPTDPTFIRAFSNDNQPWTDDGTNLRTSAERVTVGKLLIGGGGIEINGIPLNTETGIIKTAFTKKLPIIINGETYFLCLTV